MDEGAKASKGRRRSLRYSLLSSNEEIDLPIESRKLEDSKATVSDITKATGVKVRVSDTCRVTLKEYPSIEMEKEKLENEKDNFSKAKLVEGIQSESSPNLIESTGENLKPLDSTDISTKTISDPFPASASTSTDNSALTDIDPAQASASSSSTDNSATTDEDEFPTAEWATKCIFTETLVQELNDLKEKIIAYDDNNVTSIEIVNILNQAGNNHKIKGKYCHFNILSYDIPTIKKLRNLVEA